MSEPQSHRNAEGHLTDGKGRVIVSEMDDRELLEETVVLLRTLIDVLEGIGSNPMMRAMMPGGMNV